MRDAFEDKFRDAVSKSLGDAKPPEGMRERLLARLNEAESTPSPDGIDEEISSRFQERLSAHTQRANDWAPDDMVVLRTELAISAELGKDCLSERATLALSGSPGLENPFADTTKQKFLESLRHEIKRSSQQLKAPLPVRERVTRELHSQYGPATAKVVPFPGKSQWRRGLSTLATLAAGFALVILTLFGSADVALANTARLDHQNCCRMALATEGKKCRPKAELEKEFGPVPQSPLDSSWKLMLAQVCHGEDGQRMVHMLYARDKSAGGKETLSLHYFPDPQHKGASMDLSEDSLSTLSDEGFPVLGWLEGDWICTACSPELSSVELAEEVRRSDKPAQKS